MDAIAAAVAGAVIATLLGGPVAYLLGLRRSRYERLEEKRAEVIAELSRLLFEVQEDFRRWYLPSLRGGHTLSEVKGGSAEKGEAVVESLNAFVRCFHSNVAWLDTGTTALVEGSIEEFHEMLIGYGRFGRGNTHFQVTEEGKEIANRMRIRIPTIREEIIREFREILYPYEWWARIFPWRIRVKSDEEEYRSASEDIN